MPNISGKVAHLSSAHPRDDIRIFHKECKSLVGAGYAVNLVVADNLGDEICDGIQIHDVRRSNGRLRRVFGTTRRVLQRALELDADIYHLHDPELLFAGMALKRKGKLVIFDSHEDVPVQLLNKPYLTPAALQAISGAYASFERFACSRFDAIVAATPFIRDKFLRINPVTVDVCNYPVHSEFRPVSDWAEKFSEVCYVGGLSRVRGLVEMVSAIAQTGGGVRLNLAGGFSETALRNDVATSPGWSRVVEHGVLDRDGVAEIYRRSIAGLVTLHPIPNYLDALPIKMFEYMSAGIPVIASDFPKWRKMIGESDCGLCVNPRDPEAIARAIDYLITHPIEAQAMGERGRQNALSRYNWHHEGKKLVDLYQQLVSARR